MLTIYYTLGLPGSGKTTWAREKLRELGNNAAVRVNKDDLRAMMLSGWTPKAEEMIIRAEHEIADLALFIGKHVIVDNTGFHPHHQEFYKKLAKQYKASFEIQDFTHVTVEQCIKCDLIRPNSVGEKVIRDMYDKYLAPKIEVPVFDPSLPNAVICDLDGTLAILGDRDPYDASTCEEDEFNRAVDSALWGLQEEHAAEVLFVSGRTDKYRQQTTAWIEEDGWNDVPSGLFMRKEGDNRRDSIVKREIYEEHIKGKYNVVAIFDDRPSVIRECWRPLGFNGKIFDVGLGKEF